MHGRAHAAHMIQKKKKKGETVSAPFFACSSLAASVKEEVEFHGAEAPAGFRSRSGERDKYLARERGEKEEGRL